MTASCVQPTQTAHSPLCVDIMVAAPALMIYHISVVMESFVDQLLNVSMGVACPCSILGTTAENAVKFINKISENFRLHCM